MEGSPFVADALAVIDAGGKQFAEPPALDMDALMLSVTLADGSNWSVLGGEYPASTTALGQDATLSFAHLPLSQVLQKLVKNRPVAVAAAAVPAVRPKVPASPLELDMDKALAGRYRHVTGLKRDQDGSLSFAVRGKSFTVSVNESEYPRSSCVLCEGGMSLVNTPLPTYLAKLDDDAAAMPSRSKKQKSESESSSGEGDEEDEMGDDDEEAARLASSGECCSEDLAHFAVAEPCAALARDMAAVTDRFGADSCFVFNQVEDQMTLGVHLYPSFLSTRVCTAWGIVLGLPIVISLRDVSAGAYCAAPPPSVKLWQDIDGGPQQHGVIPQLQNIAQEFVKDQWLKFRERDCVYLQNTTGARSVLAKSAEGSAATLVQKGFSQRQAQKALKAAKGDLEEAVAALTGEKSCTSLSKKTNKKGTTAVASSPMYGAIEAAARKKSSFVINPASGLLVGLIEYLTFRLGSLNEFCPLCDEGHAFGAPMLKPAICRRELCAFAFSKLGVMSGTVDGVATQAEVVDLLVSMCKAAATSARARDVLDPCPLIYDPHDPDKPLISTISDLPLILEALNGIKMSTMMEVSKNKVPDVHRLSYPMMQWVVSSNRSHLVKLGPEKHLACMGTPHQFLLLSAPPEVEEIFAARKKAKGTVWAFHGSRTENWHAILRQGVRNMSGTKGQLNGAAYGPGVYVSPTASMSLNYSQAVGRGAVTAGKKGGDGSGSGEFLDGGEFFCMSICEIIAGAETRHNAGVWTVVDDTQIVTRFFMVWPPGISTAIASKVVSTDSTFFRQVGQAMVGFD